MDMNKIMAMVGSISNPQQAIDMLLNRLPQQSSELIKNMMHSGKKPQQAITEFARSGQINIDQLRQAKNYYNLAKSIGIKISVPDNVWKEAEELIISSKNGSSTIPKIEHDYKKF